MRIFTIDAGALIQALFAKWNGLVAADTVFDLQLFVYVVYEEAYLALLTARFVIAPEAIITKGHQATLADVAHSNLIQSTNVF